MVEDPIERAQELETQYQKLLADHDQAQSDLLAKIEDFVQEIQRPCVARRLKHAVS